MNYVKSNSLSSLLAYSVYAEYAEIIETQGFYLL